MCEIVASFASASPELRVARCERVLCATPGYLEKYGRPNTPRELDRHECIEYEYLSEQGWAFHDGESTTRIMPTGRVRVNAGWAMRALALSGVGIALLPRFLVEADLAEDRLETVLEGVLDADIDVMAILPARRQISAKVRSFLDYGVAQLSKAPWARRIAEPEPTADRPSSDDD